MRDLGIIGVGVMGRNLAQNAVDKGFAVTVWDQNPQAVQDCVSADSRIEGAPALGTLVQSLSRPRKILLMVKAGEAVDSLIEALLAHLEPGDVLLDGGNSHFADTERRFRDLGEKGIEYLGVGISGGEQGARRGPSMMGGGSPAGWDTVRPVLQAMAANASDGQPCADRVGSGGSGHYVKMIHNGIEYGDMQLIAEAVACLRSVNGMDYPEMAECFRQWNGGRLGSYLIEITAHLLAMKDASTGSPIVEVIHDGAGQKGTGRWMSQDSLELGVPSTLVTEAVFARVISSQPELRQRGQELLKTDSSASVRTLPTEDLESALYAAKVCSYAQGFLQLEKASSEHGWNLDPARVARLWRAGCIIRSDFLDAIAKAYEDAPKLTCLVFAPAFLEGVRLGRERLRRIVATAVAAGVPVPAFTAALTFLDSLASERLPTQLVQAQRDYFGAHGFRRWDREGTFHLDPATE